MDQQEEHIHIIHTGPKLDPDACRHPAAKQYTWWAQGIAGRILCAVCLQCNSVLAGAEDDATGYLECPKCGRHGLWHNTKEGGWICHVCDAGPYIMVFEDAKVEPPKSARWQCPTCDQWHMRQVEKPTQPGLSDGWYVCGSCEYGCKGSALLAAGRGGYRPAGGM